MAEAEIDVAVLFGGPSAEHEISVQSAATVIRCLAKGKYRVHPVRLERHGSWSVATPCKDLGDARFGDPCSVFQGLAHLQQVDVVFPCVHGELGEDGKIQGMLDVLRIPYVGSGVRASSVSMDKEKSKALVQAVSIRVLPSLTVDRFRWQKDRQAVLEELGCLSLPRIVKPLDAGSSVGLTRVDRPDQFEAAVEAGLSVEECSAVVAEQFLAGEEMTCVVIGGGDHDVVALPPIGIRVPGGGLFDYRAKYTPGGAEEICPAPQPAELQEAVKAAACTIYRLLGCRGLARVDFLIDDETPVFLECNTLPGMTDGSLAPKAVLAAGMTLEGFADRLVREALPLAGPRARTRAGSGS